MGTFYVIYFFAKAVPVFGFDKYYFIWIEDTISATQRLEVKILTYGLIVVLLETISLIK